MRTRRIGIYAGTFNPVHVGHIAFALQALQAAKLDAVYFLPERRPRHKKGVEHFGHRVAMLKTATRPHTKLGVLELDDVSFTIRRTLPNLQLLFADSQLVFLVGSDVAQYVPDWPLSDRLLEGHELVIGVRAGQDGAAVKRAVSLWDTPPRRLHVVDSYAPQVSSHSIREALRARQYTAGLLRSVAQYSNRHWLYVSVA